MRERGKERGKNGWGRWRGIVKEGMGEEGVNRGGKGMSVAPASTPRSSSAQ